MPGLHTILFVLIDQHRYDRVNGHGRWTKAVPRQPSIGVPPAVAGPGVRDVDSIGTPVTTLGYAGPEGLDDPAQRPVEPYPDIADDSATKPDEVVC